MGRPLFSCVISNYNYAQYLGEAIDSVLSQDVGEIELIVGDDASTDSSREVIRKYGDRIRPFFFKKNRGVFATIHDLFKEVRGKYVHFFSSDDLYMPGFVSNCIHLMEMEKLKLCCTDIRYFTENEHRDTKLYNTNEPIAFHKNQIVNVFRNSDFWIPGVSCITEIETKRKYGLPPQKLENISDWYLFHKIALFEGVGYCPQIGIAMRESQASFTAQVKRDRKRRNATYFEVLRLVSEDQELRKRFRDSAQLTFILDNLFWKLIFKPKWWDFFYRSKSSVKKRIFSSFGKRLGFR